MLSKEVPFLRIVIPLSSGIITGFYQEPGQIFLSICIILTAITFGVSLFFNKRELNFIYGISLTFAFFICGILLFRHEKESLSVLNPEESVFLCSVSEFPEEKENSYRLFVRLYARDEEQDIVPLKGSLLLYMKKEPEIKDYLPGDFLLIRCRPEPVNNRGNPCEFDYRFYLENHGIRYFAYCSAEDILNHSEPDRRKVLHTALVFRRKIISVYRELGITGDRLGLVAAITLGDKNMLDPDQKQLFINAGVMHIMAVSGLHVVILSIFIFRLLFFLKKRMNFLRIIIVVMILWGFAFVTGLSPSVIRATLMFTFLQAGGLMKRNVNSVNSVLASAMVLLTVRPTVIFDAGFLLSYSSVIFIVCFYREVYLKLRFITWIADKIWQSAVITVIAQAGTFPLTVALFNRFPVWFILTNIVIVPLSSFVVILGCVIPAVSPLKSISVPLASLLKFLTGVTEELTETAASLPYATIDNIGITSVEAMLLSLVLLLLFFCFTGTKKITMKIFLYSLIAFLFAVTFSDISSKATSELYVYNVRGQGIAGVRTGKRLTIYQDQQAVPAEILRHCSVKRLRVKVVNPGNKSWILMTSDSKILLGPSLTAGLIDQVRPDFVILTGNKPWTGEKTGTSHRVRAVIVTTSMVPGYSASGNREFFCRTDSVHYIKKSGAYRHRL